MGLIVVAVSVGDVPDIRDLEPPIRLDEGPQKDIGGGRTGRRGPIIASLPGTAAEEEKGCRIYRNTERVRCLARVIWDTSPPRAGERDRR